MMSLQLAAQNLALAIKLLNSCGKVDCNIVGNSATAYVRDWELFNSIQESFTVQKDPSNKNYPYVLTKIVDDIKFHYYVWVKDVNQILPGVEDDNHAA